MKKGKVKEEEGGGGGGGRGGGGCLNHHQTYVRSVVHIISYHINSELDSARCDDEVSGKW